MATEEDDERTTPEDLRLRFLTEARRKELSGVEGMSTRELFSTLRGMQRQDVAGTRLAGLANTIRAAFTKDRTVSKYERKEPEAPEMTAKDKLKLGDIERALKDLGESTQKIRDGNLDAITQRRQLLSDLITAATSAMTTYATSVGRKDQAKLRAAEGSIKDAREAFKLLGFGGLVTPTSKEFADLSDVDRVNMAKFLRYGVDDVAALVAAADEDARGTLLGTIEADMVAEARGGAALGKEDEAEAKAKQKMESIRAGVTVLSQEGMSMLQQEAKQTAADTFNDAIFNETNHIAIVPVPQDDGSVKFVEKTVDNIAEFKALIAQGAQIGVKGKPARLLAETLLVPAAIVDQSRNIVRKVAVLYSVIGSKQQVAALEAMMGRLSGKPEAGVDEQLNAILGLKPGDTEKRLAAIKAERSELFADVPEVVRPATKQSIQQELARRQLEFGREQGTTLPDNFYRQTYRLAAREGRGRDITQPGAGTAPTPDGLRVKFNAEQKLRNQLRADRFDDLPDDDEMAP